MKAKYSILDLQLPACAADVSFVTTLFAGVDLQGSDGRGVSQLPICADTLFFLLNECSLSQNECLGPLQTNFYRTFGRFVSALLIMFLFKIFLNASERTSIIMLPLTRHSRLKSYLVTQLFFLSEGNLFFKKGLDQDT